MYIIHSLSPLKKKYIYIYASKVTMRSVNGWLCSFLPSTCKANDSSKQDHPDNQCLNWIPGVHVHNQFTFQNTEANFKNGQNPAH